jgi:putative copper export protein/methionine-rich copper-binding protein CopC
MDRVTRALLVFGVTASVTLALAGSASAHANLASSDPAANALLDHAPADVTMTFTEPPDPKLSIVHVLDVNGADVEAGPVHAVPGQDDQLLSPLPDSLPDGVYTVSWRVVSEADGHTTAGAFSFGVNVAPGEAANRIPVPTTPPPSALSVAGRFALYVGLAILFAAALVGTLAFGGDVPARRPLLLSGAASALLGTVATLFAERATVGVSMGELLSSSTGADFIWLLGAVSVAAIAAIVASVRSDRISLLVTGVAAAVAMLVRAIGGHAAAAATPALQIGMQSLHFMAASAWMGGLLLASIAVRAHRDRDGGAPIDEIRRYSTLAGYALAVVLITGVLRATDEVGGVSDVLHLFRGSYGTTLDIKVAVVLALIGLGAVNRYRSISRMGTRPGMLRRVMAIELVGAVGVFGLTGTLTGLAPRPPVTPPLPPPPGLRLTGSDFATTMKVTVVASPGTAGPNAFEVDVRDFDSGTPLDATGVSLRFEPVGRTGVGAGTLELTRHGDHWMGDGNQVSIAGVWTVTVVVQTSSSGAEIPLTLVTRIPDQHVTVATAAGQPDIYSIVMQGGEQLQLYNDPGAPGADELHLTAFDTDGNELPLSPPTMVAVGPDGTASSLPPRRFSAGHFVGDLTLTAGRWTFFVQATARDGRVLVASFEQTI